MEENSTTVIVPLQIYFDEIFSRASSEDILSKNS